MSIISTNTTITVPAGALLLFKAGGIARAIDDAGNVYQIGLNDMIMGPYVKAQTVEVLVTSGSIEYVVDTDGDASDVVKFDRYSNTITDPASLDAVRGAVMLTVEAAPSVDCYPEVVAKLAVLKAAGGGTLRFPYIGGVGYHTSHKILVDFSNCTILLEDDVRYTGTAAIDAVFHFKGSISPANYIERPALIAPRRVKIDANGRNLVGYVQPAPGSASGFMFGVWFQFCKQIALENIYVYNGIAGGIIGSYCLGGKLINPEVSDVYYDNGIYFYNNGEHYGLPSATDPSTWANIEVKNPKAWNCANHGLGIYGAIGVTYENPKVWNCGNNTVNGPDGFPRAAGPAGGIGIEFDSNTDPTAAQDYRCTIINPQVTGSYGFGIRTNCKGTEVRGGFVRGTKIPTNHTDVSPPIWGSGVFVQNNAEAVITCDLIDNERHGIRAQGANTGSQFPAVRFDAMIKGSGQEAIQAVGIALVSVAPTARLVSNGLTGPAAAGAGYVTVNINNNIAGYNQNAGSALISGRYDDNGGQVAQTNAVGLVDLKAITGNNNCNTMTAGAKHAIYVPTAVTLTASTIMLTGTAQTRVLKVDACTKAVLDRQSILGDQTSTSSPRADVVATTLIGELVSTSSPATAPSFIGQRAINTATGQSFVAKGQASATDWSPLFTDSTGTPGNVTNNSPRGRVALAAAASTIVVTNSLVTASSMVKCQLRATDGSATAITTVITAAGSFTITFNGAASGTNARVDFQVEN
jgi:hypothetical protein